MSADEWADVDARAPREYRLLLATVGEYGWEVRRELLGDARAETLRVQLFGPQNYVGQVVFRAQAHGGVMGALVLGESVLGRFRARPTQFGDVLAIVHANRVRARHRALRRAA